MQSNHWRAGGQPLILLVDDEPAVLASLNECLRHDFRTRVANGGLRACEVAALTPTPDLVLLDVEMKDIDGYEVCRILKDDIRTRDIPVIFLTAHNDVTDVTRGFSLGAIDYVKKPIVPPILRARIWNQLKLEEAKRRLVDQNAVLESMVAERTAALQKQTEEVLRTQEATILALGALAETRDNETGNHIRRTQGYVRELCDGVRKTTSEYGDSEFELMWKTAPLHDIGKVGIPDAILLKPGKLTSYEFEVMKQHTVLGKQALGAEKTVSSGKRDFLRIAMEIACYHHEKWNGLGYPEGLSGTSIPLPARMMAVADVYDALVSRRVYKSAIPHADAVEIIRADRGTHFDPSIVDCFIEKAEVFARIADRYAEPDCQHLEPALERG